MKPGVPAIVAQGGDGARPLPSRWACRPRGAVGIHTNMPSAVPAEIWQALPTHTTGWTLGGRDVRFERLDYFFSHGLAYASNGQSATDAVRDRGFPVGLAAWFLDHDLKSYELDRANVRRAVRRSHARRRPRQHLDHVAHEDGGVGRPFVLGEQAGLLRSGECPYPRGRERLPGRAIPVPSKLGRTSVPQAHSLQPARKGRPLRGLGATGAALSGNASVIQSVRNA